MRDLIGLACDGCKRRNYTTSKNKKRQTEKFCDQEVLSELPEPYGT